MVTIMDPLWSKVVVYLIYGYCPTRLDVLLILREADYVPFKKIQESVERDRMPATTLSNINHGLERLGLVGSQIQGKKTIVKLTSLGQVSLDVFMDYHSRLGKFILEDWKRRLNEDFGIRFQV